jgi:hypothetical protein
VRVLTVNRMMTRFMQAADVFSPHKYLTGSPSTCHSKVGGLLTGIAEGVSKMAELKFPIYDAQGKVTGYFGIVEPLRHALLGADLGEGVAYARYYLLYVVRDLRELGTLERARWKNRIGM